MKLDSVATSDLAQMPARARALEEAGYDGLLTEESGHDLNACSKGRMVLGLGSQIRPHITKRFSMPWSKPAARRRREDFELMCPVFIVTGETEEEMARSRQQIKQQIAFYGSTPAYRMVLETHGWEELQGELNAMSKRGLWVEMGELIGPDVLDAFTVQAESPQDIAAGFVGRFGDLIDRTAGAYMHLSPERERQLIDAFRSLSK